MPHKANDFPTPTGLPSIPLPRGAAAQIARRLRPTVTVQHVCEVAKGNRRAARVRGAIERYVAREGAAPASP